MLSKTDTRNICEILLTAATRVVAYDTNDPGDVCAAIDTAARELLTDPRELLPNPADRTISWEAKQWLRWNLIGSRPPKPVVLSVQDPPGSDAVLTTWQQFRDTATGSTPLPGGDRRRDPGEVLCPPLGELLSGMTSAEIANAMREAAK